MFWAANCSLVGGGGPGPAVELGHQGNERRGVGAHSRRLRQLLPGGGQHPRQGAEAVDQLVSQGIGVPAGDSVIQQQLQRLVLRHAVQSVVQKLLPLPLAVSVMHAHGPRPPLGPRPVVIQYIIETFVSQEKPVKKSFFFSVNSC